MIPRLRHLLVGDAISAEEQLHPQVQLAMKERFRSTMLLSVSAVMPTAFAVAALLWRHASHTGLIIFIALLAVNTACHWFLHLRLPVDSDWKRPAIFCQITGAIPWALLPWLANPAKPEWKMWVACLILGVLASNAIFGSQFAWSFYPFQVVVTVIGSAGLFKTADAAGFGAGAIVLYAGIFSAFLAHLTRASGIAAAVFTTRSAELASGLAKEQKLLQKANAQLVGQTRSDTLTGLANRLRFTDELERAIAETAMPGTSTSDVPPVTLAFLDLDRFKIVNDTFGHRIGDLLLVSVATRLNAQLLEGELLSRHGGDELTVLSRDATSESAPGGLGARLLQAFAEPFVIEGRVLDVGASVGIAQAEPGGTADDLIRFADTALYRAKSSGGNSIAIFGPAMRAELEAKATLESELIEAFAQDHIVPYLQPIVDLSTGAILGAEALVRWEHPSGVRAAGSFIDVLTDIGLLEQLNFLMVEQVNDFRLLGNPASKSLTVSINVSPRHFEQVLTKYANTGALENTVLEITEGHSFPDMARAKQLVDIARQAGARVVLDDFGVGFSSLSIAVTLDVDGLKIDRQFVQDINDGGGSPAVVAAVVAMGHRLHLDVVAEGVETHEELAVLRELGVTRAQGYLFDPALPLDRIANLLESDHRYQVFANAPVG